MSVLEEDHFNVQPMLQMYLVVSGFLSMHTSAASSEMMLRSVWDSFIQYRCPNVAQNDPFTVPYKVAKVFTTSFEIQHILTALNAPTHLPKAQCLLWAECRALSPLLMTCDPAG